MDIVHIASELAPIAKVGGLGDVLFGLSNALVRKGHRVWVILPKYDCINYHSVKELRVEQENFEVEHISNTLWSAKLNELNLILIEDHHSKRYFARGAIYEEADDAERFLYFCKVASAYLETRLPDVVHLHDWPTAGCALLLQNKVKTIFTIHSLYHQGICPLSNLDALGYPFDKKLLSDPNEMEAINLLKGAIHTASVITTVSPSYAKEILTPENGLDLDEDLLRHKKQLKGILNGIDVDYWNPKTDPLLVKNYDLGDFAQGKRENKQHIQKRFGLPFDEKKPLVVAITRLVMQKGPDLIEYGIERTLELGGQFVLLGSSVGPELRAQFEALDPHPDVAIHLAYDESLSHLLFAASDLLLMPSIFEPCGLTQMIAMRYGSIPLVRATGGLKDTVIDGQNGFSFEIPDNRGVSLVLEKGFEAIRTAQWETLIQNAMQADWSWDASANQYLEIYQ